MTGVQTCALPIFFAEDDRSIRETTSDLLAMSGFRVEAVRTGREASRLLARRPVDLLITDLVMPDGDGLWLLEHLQQASPKKQIPVILLTAHADTTDRAAGARARADAYLTKPFEPEELVATVRRLLSAAGAADALLR